MLSENIRNLRKRKGISQEALAVRLNVVRQTVSKWEKGLSVPDSEMLVAISEVLETPVSSLLGETMAASEPDDLKCVAEMLETINLQLLREKNARRNALHWFFIAAGLFLILGSVALVLWKSPYLGWDYGDPEAAVLGVAFHTIEWLYVRIAPAAFAGTVVGAILTRKKG